MNDDPRGYGFTVRELIQVLQTKYGSDLDRKVYIDVGDSLGPVTDIEDHTFTTGSGHSFPVVFIRGDEADDPA